MCNLYEIKKYLLDKNGEILRTADGTPMDYDSFDQDASSKYYIQKSIKTLFYESLRNGINIPVERLKDAGFVQINGRWIHKSDIV